MGRVTYAQPGKGLYFARAMKRIEKHVGYIKNGLNGPRAVARRLRQNEGRRQG